MIVACFSLILVMTTAVTPSHKPSDSTKMISKREVSASCDKGWYPFDASTLSVGKGIVSSKVISKREVQTSCEKGWFHFGDKCYKAAGTKERRQTFYESLIRCKELGGTLASIHSHEQLDFLTAFILMNIKESAWIGLVLYSDSRDQWRDGTAIDFTNWETAEEPKGIDITGCVEFLSYTNRKKGKPGLWRTEHCDAYKESICQKQETKQAATGHTDPRFCSPPIGGWKLEKSCYHVVSKRLTWEEAEKYCIENHSGHLVTINERSVNLFIEYIVRNYTEDMWIGLKFKNEYQQQWSSGWYMAFTNWLEEPGVFLDGTCAIRTLDKWIIVPCTRRVPFICEISTEPVPVLKSSEQFFCPNKPPGWRDLTGDFCYYFEPNSFSWYEANFRCLRRGGTLASFHSQTELEIVQPFMLNNFIEYRLRTWIGLYRHMRYDEEFMWVDGSPMDFKAWGNNEPNSEREKCAQMNPESLKWNDFICEETWPSVCSVRKMTSNKTTESTIVTPACSTGGFSTEALIGVILCVVLVVILLGTIVYYFCRRQDKNEQQNSKTSRISHQPQLPDQRMKYRSANRIALGEDGYVKNIDDDYEYL